MTNIGFSLCIKIFNFFLKNIKLTIFQNVKHGFWSVHKSIDI